MTDRYAGSRQRLERAAKTLTGGVSSPFRAKAPVPLFFREGIGPRLWDVDGNSYIDYALAWGPMILGHCHPRIVEAMKEQASRPHNYGAQHDLEYEVSERINRMVPCAELSAYTCSGSEAVAAVHRLARGFTGKPRVVRFEGHYHGWHDQTLISYRPTAERMGSDERPCPTLDSKGQVANVVDNMAVAPWNDIPALEQLLDRYQGEVAAVITEPVLCNSGCLMPAEGFLKALRRITQERGILLIFDEVITGFRIANGGAQEAFGVTPDLATFGKAIAAGIVLSAFAGRRDIMEMMLTGGVAYGGTFNGNPMSMGAAKATLDVLAENDGAALKNANRVGALIRQGIVEEAQNAGIPLTATGFGTAFSLHFGKNSTFRNYRDTLKDDKATLAQFLRLMLDEGIYLLPDGRIYVSAVHTEREAEETKLAARRVFEKMRHS